jgi:phosphonate transport system substrate-binding protein
MQTGSALNFRLGYYPWITQHIEPAKIKSSVELFASTVEKELQRTLPRAKVVVTDPVDVPQQIDRIISNERVIELMNPLGFVFGRLKSQKLEAVAVAQRIIDGRVGVTYFAQLYTHVDWGMTSIDQAAQKSVGYGVPFSTSNFLIPALELQKKRVHPFCHFKGIQFLGGHDKVAMAVYNKQVALGAGHDGVIIDLSNQQGFGDAQSKLKTLVRSPPIPSDPIAVNIPDDAERKEVAAALVRAGGTPDGKQALADFWGKAQGLEATSSQKYDVIQTAIEELRLRPEDLLPKS